MLTASLITECTGLDCFEAFTGPSCKTTDSWVSSSIGIPTFLSCKTIQHKDYEAQWEQYGAFPGLLRIGLYQFLLEVEIAADGKIGRITCTQTEHAVTLTEGTNLFSKWVSILYDDACLDDDLYRFDSRHILNAAYLKPEIRGMWYGNLKLGFRSVRPCSCDSLDFEISQFSPVLGSIEYKLEYSCRPCAKTVEVASACLECYTRTKDFKEVLRYVRHKGSEALRQAQREQLDRQLDEWVRLGRLEERQLDENLRIMGFADSDTRLRIRGLADDDTRLRIRSMTDDDRVRIRDLPDDDERLRIMGFADYERLRIRGLADLAYEERLRIRDLADDDKDAVQQS